MQTTFNAKTFLIQALISLGSWIALLAPSEAAAPRAVAPDSPGDRMIADYFKKQTSLLQEQGLAQIQNLEDWNQNKGRFREELFEMLSLSPRPERTDLKAVVTGKLEHEEFVVEKLHYQSMPGLYVTANLYLPKRREKPLPAILYVCGHSHQAQDGVSFGNKAGYQHHGAWFARHGYLCLTIDTIQLGEIPGIHHGTYREGMWWWNARGYSSAGVEAWNSIRALDYLQSRPEVDGERLGVTGRSGGGAYSWWLVALDDRVKAAAPVAGITDLQNHVVDGVVEGHCDCMYIVNTYQWDYAQVAALAAPRPLLIANSDKDSIFPLDGVYRIHQQARRIYDLHQAGDKLGLLITEGPHRDTQDLQVPVFRWFNKHLKGEDPLIEKAAVKMFEPRQLRVFDQLPSDERSSHIHETFVPMASNPPIPGSPSDWQRMRGKWETALREKVFRAWPAATEPVSLEQLSASEAEGLRVTFFRFESQPGIRLPLVLVEPSETKDPERVILQVLDDQGWQQFLAPLASRFSKTVAAQAGLKLELPDTEVRVSSRELVRLMAAALAREKSARVALAPRGIGPTAWNADPRKQIQIRRRFMLLGQTLDAMRVWDARRAIQAVQAMDAFKEIPLQLEGRGDMGVNALYAALFEPGVARVRLRELPASHRQGPDYLNVLRFLDIPQAVAMAAEKRPVQILSSDAAHWRFPLQVAEQLQWAPGQIQLE